jgi:F0F1-type ATP synthase delta subunit
VIKLSRRQLAKYAADEIASGQARQTLAKKLAASLISTGKQKETDLLFSDIDQILEERQLITKVKVTSAHPLPAKLKTKLLANIRKISGSKNVVLQEEIDKNLIGGFKVETASRTWDKTLKRMLIKLKED